MKLKNKSSYCSPLYIIVWIDAYHECILLDMVFYNAETVEEIIHEHTLKPRCYRVIIKLHLGIS